MHYIGSTIYDVDPDRLIVIREYEFSVPSICPEFDPNPEESIYHAEVVDVSLKPNGYRRFICTTEPGAWRGLKSLYDTVSKESFRGRVSFRKQLWKIIRGCTPYENLSARQQMSVDMKEGTYPKPESKYCVEATLEELEEIKNDLVLETVQNLNDWKIYREPIPETYMNNQRYKISRINELIKTKNK